MKGDNPNAVTAGIFHPLLHPDLSAPRNNRESLQSSRPEVPRGYLKGFTSHGLGRFPQYIVSIDAGSSRSEERRVGKECRSRWSPYH